MPIIQAMADGIGAPVMHHHTIRRAAKGIDTAIVYGILRGGYEAMTLARQYRKQFIYMDHGYFGRNRNPYKLEQGYYRATYNATQQQTVKDRPTDRLERHNIQFKDWKLSGDTVLFAYQSTHWNRAFHSNNFVNDIRSRIAPQMKSMGLHMSFRQKSHAHVPLEWGRVYCVVTHSSAIALEAVARGIPAIVHQSHALGAVGATVPDLESLWMGDRVPFFSSLAYSQFTLEEMRSGFAWEELHRVR